MFPTVLGVVHSHENANTTTFTVSLPDGSNVVGRLLIVAAAKDGTATMTWPANWNVINNGGSPGNNVRLDVRYHIVDGTEGYPATGATITITGDSQEYAGSAFLIDDHNSSVNPPEGTGAGGTSGDGDPPSYTATWGADDNLWLAFHANDGAQSVNGYPTNYDDNQHGDNTGGAEAVTHACATRNLNAATEDPGVFDTASDWRDVTAVVQGAAPGGGEALMGGGFGV